MAFLLRPVCPSNVRLSLPTPQRFASAMALLNDATQCNFVESITQPSLRTQQKLTGRAFYESLGSPKMILAPMVDQSEFVC